MTNSTRRMGFVPGLVAGLTLVFMTGVPTGSAYHTNFQGNCNNQTYAYNPIKRSTARSYAFVGHREGYQWGGGCWNDSDHDNSPNDPTQDPNTRGEGGDCSGFTFKSWYERSDTADAGFRWHDNMRNIHGPYTANSFKNGYGAPNVTVAKSNTIFMDAFASTGHIGMIYRGQTAYNTDEIIEAKSESVGTKILSETYRGNSAYSGVRRRDWRPECYPQCI